MSVQEHQKINSAVQPTTVKSEYASVGDLEMYYEIHGTGATAGFAHGAFMSATIYPALAVSVFRVNRSTLRNNRLPLVW